MKFLPPAEPAFTERIRSKSGSYRVRQTSPTCFLVERLRSSNFSRELVGVAQTLAGAKSIITRSRKRSGS